MNELIIKCRCPVAGAEASNINGSWRAPWAPEAWSEEPEPEAPENPELGACLAPEK